MEGERGPPVRDHNIAYRAPTLIARILHCFNQDCELSSALQTVTGIDDSEYPSQALLDEVTQSNRPVVVQPGFEVTSAFVEKILPD